MRTGRMGCLPLAAALGILVGGAAAAPAHTHAQEPAQEPAPDDPAPTRFEGAGYAVEVPDGWEAWQGSNGTVYFLEVGRRGVAGTPPAALAHVQLAIVPAAVATPEAVVEGMIAELTAKMQAAKRSPGAAQPTTRTICGAERSGRAVTWNHAEKDDAAMRSETYAWADGDWIRSVQVRNHVGDDDADGLDDGILATVVARPFDPQATRRVRLGPHSFALPVMTPCDRFLDGEVTTVRMAWPPGQIEVAHLPAPGVHTGRSFAEQILEDRRKQANSQGASPPRGIQRWAGPGLAHGWAFRMPRGASDEIHVRTWAIAGDKDVIVVTWIVADPQYRAALAEQLRNVWDTLEMEGREVRLARYEGHGLSIAYDPAMLAKEEVTDEGMTFTLDPLHSSTEIRFEVTDALTPENYAEALTGLLQKEVSRRNPALAMPDTQPVGGSFLGVNSSQAISFPGGGITNEIYLFGAPLGERVALAWLETREEDSADDTWTFANLMHRVQPVPPGPRAVEITSCRFTYDPAAWRMRMWPQRGYRHDNVRLHGDGGYVTITTTSDKADRGFGGFSGGSQEIDPVQHLVSEATRKAERALLDEKREGWDVGDLGRATRPLAGSFAIVRSYERRNGRSAQRKSHILFATGSEVVEVITAVPLDDGGTLDAAVEEVLASLAATSQLDNDAMRPSEKTAAGITVTVPAGFRAHTGARLGDADLRIEPSGARDAALTLTVVAAGSAAESEAAVLAHVSLHEVGDLLVRVEREGSPWERATCAPSYDAILASLKPAGD